MPTSSVMPSREHYFKNCRQHAITADPHEWVYASTNWKHALYKVAMQQVNYTTLSY